MPPKGTWTSAPVVVELMWMTPACAVLANRWGSRGWWLKMAADSPSSTALPRPLAPGLLDGLQDGVVLTLVDQRADLRARIGGVADHCVARPREQPLSEVVIDHLLDEDASGRRALLSGRQERAGVGGRDGPIEIGVGHDDERVVAAHLELRPLATCGCLVANVPSNRHRTRERHCSHLGSRDERSAVSGPCPITTLSTPGGRPASVMQRAK
jgi:hypothetical protein